MVEKWRMKAKETKSVQVTFTLKKEHVPLRPLRQQTTLTKTEDVKYLGILDRILTWRKHIFTNRKQMDLKLRKLYWIIGR